MTPAVNIANLLQANLSQNSAASNSKTGSEKGIKVFIPGKMDFKSVFSQTAKGGGVKKKDNSDSQLTLLLKFLKMPAAEQKKILKDLDPDKLKELDQLLNFILQGLQQKLDSNLNQGNFNQLDLKGLLDSERSTGKSVADLSNLKSSLLKIKKLIKMVSQEGANSGIKNAGDNVRDLEKNNPLSDRSAVAKGPPVSDKQGLDNKPSENRFILKSNKEEVIKTDVKKDKKDIKLKNTEMKQLIASKVSGKTNKSNHDKASFFKLNYLSDGSKTVKTQDQFKSLDLFNKSVKSTGNQEKGFSGEQDTGKEESFKESSFMKSNLQVKSNHVGSAEKKGLSHQMKMADVIKQITDQIRVNKKPGNNELEIRLEPKSLGKVKLSLKVEAGKVIVRMSVENQNVKNYLEQNLSSLKTNLIRQGFTADQIHIESNNPNSGLHQEMDFNQQFNGQQENHSNTGQGAEQNGDYGDEFSDLNYDDLEDLIQNGSEDLVETILKDRQWSNYNNYGYHRMNLLA